jgi:hypothetical protein
MGLFAVYLIILIGLGILEIVLLEMEKFGRATLLMLGVAAAVQFLGIVDLWHGLLGHPVLVLEYALAYAGLGVVWSFFRWWRHLAHWRFDYQQVRDTWLKRNGFKSAADLSGEQLEKMLSSIGYNYRTVPTASSNKARITAWMVFWPLSVIGWALNEPVKRAANALFNLFKGTYQRIADYMFKDFTELKK